MKFIVIALAVLLVCLSIAPTSAQSKKKAPKAKATKPSQPDTRTVSASPVIEGDPSTKPDARADNRTVSASPVIEGDPMIPPDDCITKQELKAKLEGGMQVLILDLRSGEEWKARAAKIKGALHVSVADVEKKMTGWNKAQPIVAYCACPDDVTSAQVTRTLKAAGFKHAKALLGGWREWEQAGYPTESK